LKHGSRHDDAIASFVMVYDQPVAWQSLALAIEVLISLKGENLLRVKGIVNAKECDKPLILHGVQHLFHDPVMLPEWPDEDRRTRIVFITRDLPRQTVVDLLEHAFQFQPTGEDEGAEP
jgi:G3E family GTPase